MTRSRECSSSRSALNLLRRSAARTGGTCRLSSSTWLYAKEPRSLPFPLSRPITRQFELPPTPPSCHLFARARGAFNCWKRPRNTRVCIYTAVPTGAGPLFSLLSFFVRRLCCVPFFCLRSVQFATAAEREVQICADTGEKRAACSRTEMSRIFCFVFCGGKDWSNF